MGVSQAEIEMRSFDSGTETDALNFKVLFEAFESPRTLERLIVSKETEHNARFDFRQPFVGTAKVVFAVPNLELVARVSEISDR